MVLVWFTVIDLIGFLEKDGRELEILFREEWMIRD